MKPKNKVPTLLFSEKKNFKPDSQNAFCYPRNTRELYCVYPVTTKNSRYLEVRAFYQDRHYPKEDLYFSPGYQAIPIVTPEILNFVIESLLRLRDFISPSEKITGFAWPSGPIPFNVADDLLRAQALLKEVTERRKETPKDSDIIGV